MESDTWIGKARMKTALCDLLGIEVPIVLAPMGGVVGPEMVAAVCNAGGLGTLPASWLDDDELRQQIREIRRLTDRPFAINLVLAFPQGRRVQICAEERVPLVSFFWGDPAPFIDMLQRHGVLVMHSVGSVKEARHAFDAGVDILVAQGWEGGGHVKGTVSTLALTPAVVDAVHPRPVVAAGGIADGRGLAAILALGASAAWIGTRFLASSEANVHEHYLKRIIEATADDTVHLENLFDGGWPDAPHRVLMNSTVRNWLEAGRPPSGARPGEGERIATTDTGREVLRYDSDTAERTMTGEIEAIPLWAGQGVSVVTDVLPAGEIVRAIHDQACLIIGKLAQRE